jgi:hypothetical protein
VEDWLASRLSAVGPDDTAGDDDTDLEPTVDQDTYSEAGVGGYAAFGSASDGMTLGDHDLGLDLEEDDAATVHDDGIVGRAGTYVTSEPGGELGRVVARSPTSPELPLVAGRRAPPPPEEEPFDPVTDRLDVRRAAALGWDPDADPTPVPESGPWDELDPRAGAGSRAPEEETGVLLQHTDPSISQDQHPTEFGPEFGELRPPPGFLDLPLAGDAEEGTQWEVDRRAAPMQPLQEKTQIRYSPPGARARDDGEEYGGIDDDMPTVIARPGQFAATPAGTPRGFSAELTEALTDPPAGGYAPVNPPAPPPRPLPSPPLSPPPPTSTIELVWIASAIGGLLALALMIVTALGWLSMH